MREGPLSVNHQMSGKKTLLFLQDVFFFNLGVSKTPKSSGDKHYLRNRDRM